MESGGQMAWFMPEMNKMRAALEVAEAAMHRAICGGKISFRELDAVRDALGRKPSQSE